MAVIFVTHTCIFSSQARMERKRLISGGEKSAIVIHQVARSLSSFRKFMRKSVWDSRKRDASRIRLRAVGISLRSPISESRVLANSCPGASCARHFHLRPSRGVIGRDPRVHARAVRDQRSKVIEERDVDRAVRREFSRPSTVSKRAADRLSSRSRDTHTPSSVPYTSVATYTAHHTRAEWKRGGGARRAGGESPYTHATPTRHS